MGIAPAEKKRSLALPALVGSAAGLLLAGLFGLLTVAWGYAFFTAAVLLLAGGATFFAILALTRFGNTGFLEHGAGWLLGLGGACYVLALSSFAGFFTSETLHGRMEMRWIVFGPIVLASLIVLDKGVYRKLVGNNLPTWRRYRRYISREQSEPEAMRRTLVDDVVVHRNLFAVSKLRWLRHTLIYWGFAAMVLLELFAVFLREGLPAFGFRDVWREPGNPLRLLFDFAFDFTGLMVLVGCLLALAWRIRVNNRPERKYSDTPTTVFLLLVIASGFVVEGLRLEMSPGEPYQAASFVGVIFGHALRRVSFVQPSWYEPLWLGHVIAACGFIAYIPVKRLIHTCATPMGRLMNSQKALLAARKKGVLGGMLLNRRITVAQPESPVVDATGR